MKNKIMLITYPDSLGSNLKNLKNVLDKYFSEAVHGVHILPFFPSSGDRGFAPLKYYLVDTAYGDWGDIESLSKNYTLMFDYMINHISAQSSYYLDFLENKDRSAYSGLFIRYNNIWKNGAPTQEQVAKIYKRKPRAPYVDASFADGSNEKIWCTFGDEQIDLAIDTEEGRAFIDKNLRMLSAKGASIIRLDAFAYAVKKENSTCFFVEPEVWGLLEHCSDVLKTENTEILPEIHEHYSIQAKIASKGYYVYDFALPMLMLNALYFGKSEYLKNWFEICPRKQYTTLDTHDGIGIVDVKDLMPDFEIAATKEYLYRYGANVKEVYNTDLYNNLDIYQLNCTYYSALNNNDEAYLLARAIQFFAPGIPQVYYVGLLAGENDLTLLEATKEGRNINRHYYSVEEIEHEVKRPVVKNLIALMRLRNNCSAFNGEFCLEETLLPEELSISWTTKEESIRLDANLSTFFYSIHHLKDGKTSKITF